MQGGGGGIGRVPLLFVYVFNKWFKWISEIVRRVQ